MGTVPEAIGETSAPVAIVDQSTSHLLILDPAGAVLGWQIAHVRQVLVLVVKINVLMIQVWGLKLLMRSFGVTFVSHILILDRNASRNGISGSYEIRRSLSALEATVFIFGVGYVRAIWHHVSCSHE